MRKHMLIIGFFFHALLAATIWVIAIYETLQGDTSIHCSGGRISGCYSGSAQLFIVALMMTGLTYFIFKKIREQKK